MSFRPWKLNHTARGLFKLYSSTMMAGMWAMILPAIPVLSTSYNISAGAAAQIVPAVSVGRFIGMPISGFVLDRFGARTAAL